jgi:hypothetical protein
VTTYYEIIKVDAFLIFVRNFFRPLGERAAMRRIKKNGCSVIASDFLCALCVLCGKNLYGFNFLKSLDYFAKGQAHHICVRTHDSFYHKGPSPLNGVPAGFVKRLPGGNIPSDLRGSQGFEKDPGGYVPLFSLPAG